jgi:AcrR family transcriptional regulator
MSETVNAPTATPDPSPSHRLRKKERTRAQLVEAAIGLFTTRGFEQTTIDDIANEVGIVRRTFFHYFDSKVDALFSWYGVLRGRIEDLVRAHPAGEGALSVAVAALEDVVELYGDRMRVISIVTRLSESSPEISRRQIENRYALQRELARAIALRLDPAAALEAQAIAAIAMTAASHATDQWIAEGTARPLLTYSRAAFATVRRAFGAVDATLIVR